MAAWKAEPPIISPRSMALRAAAARGDAAAACVDRPQPTAAIKSSGNPTSNATAETGNARSSGRQVGAKGPSIAMAI
eukprot:scaffold2912_cov129-Isochrysis_galbana.AAC.1